MDMENEAKPQAGFGQLCKEIAYPATPQNVLPGAPHTGNHSTADLCAATNYGLTKTRDEEDQ